MPLIALPSLTAALGPAPCSWKAAVRGKQHLFPCNSIAEARRFEIRGFFPNSSQQPILKEALKEPVAFVGGIFAGLLRLDLNEEPLREWVARTVEASGVRADGEEEEEEEEVAQQIEIE